MAEIGANEIVPRGECDHVSGEATAFHKWIASLVGKMAIDPTASNLVLELNKQLKSSEDANSLMRIEISNSVTVHVFSSEEVKNAAGESFLRGSLMKMSNSGGKDGDRCSLIKKCVKESMMNAITFGCDYDGAVMSRDDIVTEKSLIATNDSTNRKTCLIKIDLRYCGSPPYEPGDHVQGEHYAISKKINVRVYTFKSLLI